MTFENILSEPGTLYLVSTPIGNLRDISLRALEVLKNVDIIAAEDTRTSKVLLNFYNITTPITSYHDFNKEKVAHQLVSKLLDNKSVAVISDAGTPGISDPAYYLVREAITKDIKIQSIPGATAFVPALIISGLPTDRFVFEGFLPVKKGRKTRLEALKSEQRTIVLYESPHRIKKTLSDLLEFLGDRQVAVIKEMTKKFEQVQRGYLTELTRFFKLKEKGEFVVVVEGWTRKRIKQETKSGQNYHEN